MRLNFSIENSKYDTCFFLLHILSVKCIITFGYITKGKSIKMSICIDTKAEV